ncbi:YybH family protein [Modestobacter sp. URMC 112]
MVLPDGSTVTGYEAIREVATRLVALHGRMEVTTRYVIEAGDLAILSNEWTVSAGGAAMSAVTAEVAQRQPDGGWLYVVDNPYAVVDDPSRIRTPTPASTL